ncbi:MAG: carbohydrate kinase [Symbiobacteriaceae bacterium]|nr:carbohydrate kinase [Symbiobacteriaceae bacterium]
MPYLIGLDIGTTNTKALAIDDQGRVAARHSVKTPVRFVAPDCAEHDPDALWNAAAACCRGVVEALGGAGEIVGVAAASVAEEGVLLNRQGEALGPAIAWFDQRTAPQAARWAQSFGPWETYSITGLLPDPIYSLHKLNWIRENQPEQFRQAETWLCIADYISFRLGGARAMSHSLASHTMALDLERLEWSREILAAADLPIDLFPPLVASGTVLGGVSPQAARETGLTPGTPVLAGGHDHICAALAAGAWEPGAILDSGGSVEALLVGLPKPAMTPASFAARIHFGAHTARGRYYAGTAMTSGRVMDWVRSRFFAACGTEAEAYRAMTREALASEPGARGLFLLPHLAEVAFNRRDSQGRGAVLGWRLHHTRGDIARAAFEGLAFELRALLATLEGALGLAPGSRLVATGGMASSPELLHLKASILDRQVHLPENTELTALGAAMLAGLGAGIFGSEDEAQARIAGHSASIAADPDLARCYARLFHAYERLPNIPRFGSSREEAI